MTSPGARPFETIYEDQFDYVWNTLRRLGVQERNLEDLAHDVFVIVHRKLADFDATRPLKPWLFGIAFRVASDHLKKKMHAEVLDAEIEAEDPAPLAEIRIEQADARNLVLSALLRLDEERRAVFILHELDEVPAPEIADLLNIPLNTVYSRLRLARERFTKAVRSIHREGGRA